MKLLPLFALFSIVFNSVRAEEFHDVSAAFGNTLTLAGIHHATTSNPDGTSINFWPPTSESRVATTTSLSNPHMAAADAAGNIYIADKASHAVLVIGTNGLIRTFAGSRRRFQRRRPRSGDHPPDIQRERALCPSEWDVAVKAKQDRLCS